MNEPTYISTAEAARILGTTPGALRSDRFFNRPTPPAIKAGNRLLWNRLAVEQWAAQRARAEQERRAAINAEILRLNSVQRPVLPRPEPDLPDV